MTTEPAILEIPGLTPIKTLKNFLRNILIIKTPLSKRNILFLENLHRSVLMSLQNFFHSYNKSFEIIMSSDFKWQDLQKYNVIYIGSFKSLGLFDQYLKNSNFRFNIYPNELTLHQLSPDSIFHYHSYNSDVDNAYESDHPVVTMVAGPNKHKVLLFIASRDVGLIAATRYFTDKAKLQTIEQEHFSDVKSPIYFETCFRVKGLQRNVISIELLNINLLDSSTIFEVTPKDTEAEK